ncbi:hypothetical protein VNI00_004364 [Paramarasmius palmivorus]|uniref:Uncharacterized protein n=1 Tax=Paramarasmius palmivorus TaxID=297713 RepID=A0AAW0DP24_9AGAR
MPPPKPLAEKARKSLHVDEMCKLWKIGWQEKARIKLFHPTGGAEQENVLDRYFTFGAGHPKKLLVREDIVKLYETQKRFSSAQDLEWKMWLDADVSVPEDKMKVMIKEEVMEEEEVLSDEEDIDSQEETEHPMDMDMDMDSEPEFNQVFIVTGSPGIVGPPGKTIWLYYVLVERLLQGLPTYFQYVPEFVTFWSENGVTVLEPSELFFQDFSQEIWYLLDSNVDLIIPPSAIRNSHCRIIQAASPRVERFKWVDKQGQGSFTWIMKPTSRRELILMNRYRKQVLPKHQLLFFCDHFGTSARHAFQYGSDPDRYKKQIRGRLLEMKLDDLRRLVENLVVNDTKEISHKILGIYPGPSRDDIYVNIYTPELVKLIQERFASEWDRHVWEMFNAFRSNAHTRGPAGYILADRLHQCLAGGGQWLGTKMFRVVGGRSNFTYTDNTAARLYESDPEQSPVLLSLGPGAETTSQNPQLERTPLQVFRFRYGHLADSIKKDGYYRPFSATNAAYDSFVIDIKRKTVIVIQSAMSMKHSANERGLKALEPSWSGYDIHYVIVTDDEAETVEVPFSLRCEEIVKTRAHIRISKKSLFPVSSKSLFP